MPSRPSRPSPLRSSLLLVLPLLALAACDSFPRDVEGTLERVSGGTMRVGVVENPPWTVRADTEWGGVEPRLVRAFARELGAEVEWVPGTEQEVLEGVERRQLDLAVGGLTRRSPWRKGLAFSISYLDPDVAVGVPAGAAAPGRLEGVRVGVRRGDPVAVYLRNEDAVPVPTERLAEFPGPVAAPEWWLRAHGFRPTEHVFFHERHAMAAPPGENGFLHRLDRFLRRHEAEAERLLAEEAAR